MSNYNYLKELQAIHNNIQQDYSLQKNNNQLVEDAKNLTIFLKDLKTLSQSQFGIIGQKRLNQVLVQSSLQGLYENLLSLLGNRSRALFPYKGANLQNLSVGDAAEQDLRDILDVVLQEVFNQKKGSVRVMGQKQGTTVPGAIALEDEDLIKRLMVNKIFGNMPPSMTDEDLKNINLNTDKQIKVDVGVDASDALTVNAKYSGEDLNFLTSVGRAINGAQFSVKSYSELKIKLGNTKFSRIVQGIVSQYDIGLSDLTTTRQGFLNQTERAEHVYHAGRTVIEEKTYYSDVARDQVHDYLTEMRFVYELAGAGIFIGSDNGYIPSNQVTHLVFNNNNPRAKYPFLVVPVQHLLYYYLNEENKNNILDKTRKQDIFNDDNPPTLKIRLGHFYEEYFMNNKN